MWPGRLKSSALALGFATSLAVVARSKAEIPVVVPFFFFFFFFGVWFGVDED